MQDAGRALVLSLGLLPYRLCLGVYVFYVFGDNYSVDAVVNVAGVSTVINCNEETAQAGITFYC